MVEEEEEDVVMLLAARGLQVKEASRIKAEITDRKHSVASEALMDREDLVRNMDRLLQEGEVLLTEARLVDEGPSIKVSEVL